MFSKITIFLSFFVFIESANFLWLILFSEQLFDIKGQGLEIARIHLLYIGPVFFITFLMGVFIKEKKRFCLLLCFCYIITWGGAFLLI